MPKCSLDISWREYSIIASFCGQMINSWIRVLRSFESVFSGMLSMHSLISFLAKGLFTNVKALTYSVGWVTLSVIPCCWRSFTLAIKLSFTEIDLSGGILEFHPQTALYYHQRLEGNKSACSPRWVVLSLAVRGTFGLADSTTAIFLPKDFNQSLRVSDSFRPMWCVRSLSAILNWMITSSLVARFRTKASLVPSVWILVSLSYRERKDLTAVLKSLRL